MIRPGELAVVSGGAGFIGSHLVEALLADGMRVRVVDNLATGNRSNLDHLAGRYDWIEGDVADREIAEASVDGASVVFHQAAIPSVPRSMVEPIESHRSGPTATISLLDAAQRAGVQRFVFAGSSSAYGDTDELPKHEAMMPRPLSPYAAGKLAGEHYVRVYAHSMGLDGVSLRYFNVFGVRQDPSSPYSGVISVFARAMNEGRRPRILGDGLQSRDFTHVANVVQANLLTMRSEKPLGGEVFNVGTGTRVSLRELVAAMNRVLGTSLEPEFGPTRAGDVLHSEASLAKIADVLGYRPVVDFEDGLRRTLTSSESG